MIVKIGNTSNRDFEDIRITIALSNAPKGIPLEIDRDGERFNVVVHPEYNEQAGFQIIGIMPVSSLVVE